MGLQILVRGGGKWSGKSGGNWSVTIECAEGGEGRGRQQAGETRGGLSSKKWKEENALGRGATANRTSFI